MPSGKPSTSAVSAPAEYTMTTTEEPRGADPAADLVHRIAAGDRQAEVRLIELYSHGLSYLLKRLSGTRALAEDLHQETLRIVLEKAREGALREPGKVAGFIHGTAKNLLLAEHRKAAQRPEPREVEQLPEVADPAPGALARVLHEEDRRQVRRVLSELPLVRDRQLLSRFYIVEEPKEQICEVLGLSERQFNVALFRARQRFKQLLECPPRAREPGAP